MNWTKHFFGIAVLLSFYSCYTFTGISIPDEANSFSISEFENRAFNAPPNLGNTFSESLKDKIRNESKLTYAENNGDIQFKGSVVSFDVSSVAPTAGERSAFSRLTINVSVEYDSMVEEDPAWKQNFSFFQDYGNEENLLDIQDELIDAIYTQILEDIFNKAFTNW